MTDPNPRFKIGDQIKISEGCFSPVLRSAVGVISPPPAEVVDDDPAWQRSYWKSSRVGEKASRIYWVEFDPIIPGDDPDHPIEAGEFDETDLIRVSKQLEDS